MFSAVFLGYASEADYLGSLTVDESWLPDQLRALGTAEQQTLFFAQSGRVGIFADLVYYENRVEERSWLSGKLLRQASEYYYKPDGPLWFQPVYDNAGVSVPLSQIKPSEYDYTAFQGNKMLHCGWLRYPKHTKPIKKRGERQEIQ